jgi:hypothetical protein
MAKFKAICGDEEYLVQARGKAQYEAWVAETGADVGAELCLNIVWDRC